MTRLEIDAGQLPSLFELFLAALTSSRKRPDRTTLGCAGDLSLTVRNLRLDRRHLRDYLTFFAATAALEADRILPLPTPFLYLIGQAAQLRLLTLPGFPLPLPGTVHVGQSFAVRPQGIDPGEPLQLTTGLAELTTTSKGFRFVTETRLWQGRQNLGTCRSTYLKRAKVDQGRKAMSTHRLAGSASHASTTQPSQAAEPAMERLRPETVIQGGDSANHEQPIAEWQVPLSRIRGYAWLSRDFNPIHLHSWTARLFGFRTPIAHGMMQVGNAWFLLGDLVARQLPAALPLLRGETSFDVWFRAPVRAGEHLRLLAAMQGAALEFRILTAEGRTHLEGRWQSAVVPCA